MMLCALLLPLVFAPYPTISRGGFTPKADSKPKGMLAISADRIILGDGREIEHGVLLIEDGVIRSVGTDLEIPRTAFVIDHKGVLSPGLIALHGYTGSSSDLRDSTRPELGEADVALAFDPEHFEFQEAVRAGVTSQVLTPPPQSVVGGVCAVVKSAGGRILKKEALLSLGFSSDALSSNRFPTSYSGALNELERLFEKPEGALAKASSGSLNVLMEVDSRQDVLRAIDFAVQHHLKGALNGAPWAGELAQEIKRADLAVICGPFDIGEESRDLRAVAKLAQAGVSFAFGLDEPWNRPEGLRLGAALCVREGLDPAQAWRALTADAARIAGVADRVGRLERGLDADVVLWSGNPLDMTSSIVGVVIDGRYVYGAERP